MLNQKPQPLVSIVTPVYNNEEYLADCIESILAQTYQNWDYTIVNNCSTDSSGEIARRYAGRDSRIRVLENEEFLRVLPNHNWALRQISPASKYCKLVFADDWIFPECLEKMVAIAETHPSIGIVGAYALEGRGVSCTGLPYPSTFVAGRQVCRDHLLNQQYVFGSPNSLLYRADLVRGTQPFYNEANIHADTEACFALLRKCDFGFVHQVLTFTRVREGSLTSMAMSLQTHLPGGLQILLEHGPNFLDRREQDMRLSDHLAAYYRFLGQSFLLGHKRVWTYHKAKLSASSVGFSSRRALKGIGATLLRVVTNPGLAIAKVFRSDSSVLNDRGPRNPEFDPATIPVKETRLG